MKEFFKETKQKKKLKKKHESFTVKDAVYLGAAVVGTAIAIDILGDI